MPAGPAPITDTRLPDLCEGGSGAIQPSSQPRSTMAHSIVLMVTGVSIRLRTHAASHGAGHTRPVNSGKLFVECVLPVAAIDEVVEVRDLVVHRAARGAGRERASAHAVGDAAVHAARRLI